MEHHPLSGCRWIAAAKECQSPIFLRRFTAENPLSATLHITGLGYFYAEINGNAVSDHYFQPVVSEYGPRDLSIFLYPIKDRFTHRIYFCSYDVSTLLRSGENCLSIQLGNGWYRQTERSVEGPMAYGDTLKTIFCLELVYPDRILRICSDGSETWQESNILYNNLFTGELHDFTHVPASEAPVTVLPEETAVLSPQIGIPDRCIRTILPRLIRETGGCRIYDAGENITGVVRLLANGTVGERVILRFAEKLSANGQLDFGSTGGVYICTSGRNQIQEDICICGNAPALFQPRFCWHGFRYFSLEGPGTDPQVLVIHSDAPVTAEFDSDSEGLNFLFDAFIRTQHNNMHGSFPSDCPHRERLGYTGDGQVAAAAAMMTLDCREFYRKWMRDILDTQDTVTGHVQHTAPFGGGGGGPVGWGGAIVVVPYRYFKQYGDLSLLKTAWEPIQKWIGYLQTRMDDHIITREEEKGWCLGDWVTLDPIFIPEPLVNTCLFIRCLDMLIEIAPLIERHEDIPALEALQRKCRAAIEKTYFDHATGHFFGGTQGADAYGIYAGLGDDRTKQLLIEKYDALGHFDTGFIGTDVLLEVLFRIGAAGTAYKLLSGEELGSFLYMKRHGATTIWERWDGLESHNHPMFGGCVRHLFDGFLGIRQAYGTGGYRAVTVEPQLPEGLGYLRGSLQTPAGTLRVSLHRENGTVKRSIHLP